jgi:phospholipid-binding lipoprotein MlaA
MMNFGSCRSPSSAASIHRRPHRSEHGNCRTPSFRESLVPKALAVLRRFRLEFRLILLACAALTMAECPAQADGSLTTTSIIRSSVASLEPATGDDQKKDKSLSPGNPGTSPDRDPDELLVTARKASPGDPLEKVNIKSFAATQAVDRAVFGPVALAYAHTVPRPLRSGLRNFLGNLHEPDVFLNFVLQLKPGKAAETFGRFAINSTLGVAGLFDVAKRRPFRLPRRANGFADSMGFYGLKAGPFFFLPLIGPTSLRDLVGNSLDRLVLPVAVGNPFNQITYTLPTGILSSFDRRAEFDEKLQKQRATADPYVASREYYLDRRQAEIDGLRHPHKKPE